MKKFNIYNETDKKLTKEMFYMKRILKHALKHENLKKVYFNVIIVDNDYINNLSIYDSIEEACNDFNCTSEELDIEYQDENGILIHN